MEWLSNLIFGSGVAHSILVVAIVIAIGVILGKFKLFGISLGMTWILFVGIIVSHFGITIDNTTMAFVKDFGLILFVFSLGLQVGPGFFASFKKGGVRLNLLTLILVLLSGLVTIVIHTITGIEMPTMVGVMSGAVTNTPGLGAAQQAYYEASGIMDSTIPAGYAVAYPLGVVGVILTLLGIRALFRINIDKEKEIIESGNKPKDNACKFAVEVRNEAIVGKSIYEIDKFIGHHFVVSRLYHSNGEMEIPTSHSIVNQGDRLLVITSKDNVARVEAFIGKQIEMEQKEWEKLDTNLVSRRLVVTKSEVNGKTLGDLNIRAQFGINITRVNRAGIDLVAYPGLQLQLGDRIMVVGSEKAIAKVANLVGNSAKKLREPNLIPIFIGIFLGVILGSIPIAISGLSQPVKLGIAGGPLVIAILIARFGPKFGMVTYTTMSSNMMLREIGISMFLAAVGLGAGEGFVDAIVNGGYMWILYGVLITIIPVFIISIVARYIYKLDYFTISGVICGSQTNPIALSFMNNTFDEAQIAVAYATVYPLAMFLRVLIAQILVI
ncbi:MAG: putative transporter [Bacteroidales bacterium]|nr:putative transporter [Bacteroidales bacterium]